MEGALPAQSRILVSESATETQQSNDTTNDPAVVLSGKMTLSVISDNHQEGMGCLNLKSCLSVNKDT